MSDYYQKNVESFFNSTSDVDMSQQYDMFLKFLNGTDVLDLGCGSGRDSYYFKKHGLNTTSLDYTEEFNELAKEKFDIDIINMDMRKINFTNSFDGIWACASLLHLTMDELNSITTNLANSLKDHGIIYASFKEGDFSGERNGRFFTDLNIELANKIFSDKFIVEEYFYTSDNRPDRNDRWLNLILRKNT